MQPVTPTAERYDPVTILLHWLVAILVLVQWAGGETIDWFPRGPLRVDARSVHILLGLTLTLVILGRIGWRLTRGRRLVPVAGLLGGASRLVHLALYALLVAMVGVGIALALARGDSVFDLVRLPTLGAGDRALRGALGTLHATIAWVILGLAGLHAAAGLLHHYVWRDRVLARMLRARSAARWISR